MEGPVGLPGHRARSWAIVTYAIGLAALAWSGASWPTFLAALCLGGLAALSVGLTVWPAHAGPRAAANPSMRQERARAASATAPPERRARGPLSFLRGWFRRSPAAELDFEYEDAPPAPVPPAAHVLAPADGAVRASAAPVAAPDGLVLPPAFEPEAPAAAAEFLLEAAPTAGGGRASARAPARGPAQPQRAPGEWPAPRGEHPTAKLRHARPRQDPPARDELTSRQRGEFRDRYTRGTPMLRDAMSAAPSLAAADAPTVRAEAAPADADPDWVPDGNTIGRCGGCRILVYAPTARPIRLQCPGCGKTTVLE